ncbi:MAG: cyclic pyranopterin monophosphate synthase MoaC [Caulobacterales bacterium]|nr:cyclic pyranopterin monophosphate synthase MoaC [Caulobacterales bacterium]
MNDRLTHLDAEGRARMVDVGEKPATAREAIAQGQIRMAAATLQRALSGDTPKGDVRAIAEIAGVMAGKRTAELIPLCHPIALSSLKVDVTPDDTLPGFVVTARARTIGQTGVEMEALTAASLACLTLYDMLKAIDRGMIVEGVCLLEKHGGASGSYMRGAS